MSGTKGTATNEAVAIKKMLKHEQKEAKTLYEKQCYILTINKKWRV